MYSTWRHTHNPILTVKDVMSSFFFFLIVSSSLYLISVYKTANGYDLLFPLSASTFSESMKLHIKQRKRGGDTKFSNWIFIPHKGITIGLKLLKQRMINTSVVLDVKRVTLKMPLASTVIEPMTIPRTVNKLLASCILCTWIKIPSQQWQSLDGCTVGTK